MVVMLEPGGRTTLKTNCSGCGLRDALETIMGDDRSPHPQLKLTPLPLTRYLSDFSGSRFSGKGFRRRSNCLGV